MRALTALRSLTLLLAPLSGCHESSCGQTGCLGTVEVMLAEPLVQSGTYVVDVQMGANDALRCTVQLPSLDRSCDQRWADMLVHPETGLEGLVVYRTDVSSMTISVAHDGRVIGGGTHKPRYERWFPNGPSCDAKPCQHALVEVGVVADPASSPAPPDQ